LTETTSKIYTDTYSASHPRHNETWYIFLVFIMAGNY